ncbi:6-bladed beta-propeller [Algoriphagus namhaensis]
MQRYLSVILFLLIGYSCTEGDDIKSLHTLKVDQTNTESIKMSEIVDSVFIIHPSEDGLVSTIDDLLLYGDYIFLVDKSQLRQIQVYKTDGSFLTTIKAEGQGPGQFMSPGKIRIDPAGSRLIVYCPLTKKFLLYSFEGDFQNEFLFKEIGMVGDFIPNQNELIFYNAMASAPSDRIGLVKWSDFPFQKIEYKSFGDNPIPIKSSKERYFFNVPGKEEYFFKDYLSKSFVKFDANFNETLYDLIGLNTYDFDQSKIYELSDLQEIALNFGFETVGNSLVMSKDFLIFPVFQSNKSKASILADFKNNTTIYIDKFEDDLTKLFTFSTFPARYNSTSGFAFFVVPPDYVSARVKKMNVSNNLFGEELLLIDPSTNQNPVIIGYKLKNQFEEKVD